jgi:hypothetical protein
LIRLCKQYFGDKLEPLGHLSLWKNGSRCWLQRRAPKAGARASAKIEIKQLRCPLFALGFVCAGAEREIQNNGFHAIESIRVQLLRDGIYPWLTSRAVKGVNKYLRA